MTEATAAPPPRPPRVSVVVPTCHRVLLLDRCLDALLAQILPARDYELIVVDDGPSHHARQLVYMWRKRAAARGVEVRYVVNTGVRGPAAARNMGWRIGRADIIAFTDDDTVPSPGWLSCGLAPFRAGADVVCGRVDIPLPPLPTDQQREAARRALAEFSTANCFIRKDLLASLGGFDETFRYAWREDADLYFRLLDRRAAIVRAPHALVIHPLRPVRWAGSLRQLRRGACDALLYKKHPQRYRQQIGKARWDYYAIVSFLLLAMAAGAAGATWPSAPGAAAAAPLAAGAAAAWLTLTAMLCARRLRGTSRHPAHVADIVLTSALLPPLAVFWRLAGAVRYRVAFI